MSPARRLSVSFFPSQSGHWDEGESVLFTSDLPLGVMPIGGQRHRPEYDAKLEPPDETLELVLIHALDIGDIRAHSLPDAIAEFVKTTTQYLAHFGEVYFELVPSESIDDESVESHNDETTRSPAIAGFPMIEPLPPGRVWRTPFRYIQVIPKADREHCDGRPFIPIPTQQIWHVRFPASLGSPHAHRRMLARLNPLSGLDPGFAMEIGDMGRSVGYDTSLYHAACTIRREQLTSNWGRIPSLFQIDGPTEYHSLARVLQWRRTQAVIREHVIADLNSLLERLGVEQRLVVSGLPIEKEITAALRRMQAGRISVSDAMDAGRL